MVVPIKKAGIPLRKRIFDLIIVVPLTILALPLLLGVALLVWLFLGWPVLFLQERAGLHGQIFNIYKFRSMRNAHNAHGMPLPDEQRLTPLGSFLRTTSLDELPELINVVKGEMSLVGPRPLFAQYLPRYTPEQNRRHSVLPGITGWAQVNGRNALTWPEKFALDLWYIDHWSVRLDISILLQTILKVLRQEGISATGQVSADEFLGENTSRESPTQKVG